MLKGIAGEIPAAGNELTTGKAGTAFRTSDAGYVFPKVGIAALGPRKGNIRGVGNPGRGGARNLGVAGNPGGVGNPGVRNVAVAGNTGGARNLGVAGNPGAGITLAGTCQGASATGA